MWALRILSGPQAGQVYLLKNGKNRMGRSAESDFQLSGNGISKNHFDVTVFPDKVILTDLKSSNGTFLNGLRVHHSVIRLGDKLAAHDTLFEIILAPERKTQATALPVATRTPAYQQNMPTYSQPFPTLSQGPFPHPEMAQHLGRIEESIPSRDLLIRRIQKYVNEVVMPSLHRLVEVFEFQKVILGFAVAFVLMVTLLSMLPMNQITSESIETESRRRALTVARALANANQRVLRSNDISSFSTDLILREDGIEDVYILSKDGSILAPPERAGSTPKQAGFAKAIKGQTKDITDKLSGGLIAASTAILAFDADLQANTAKAHVVVIYNPGSLKFDDGRALSLFFQMLVLASLIGGVLFFLMYKLIEYPFLRLSQEIDSAITEGRDHADVPINFPALQKVVVTTNSLLSRSSQVSAGGVGEAASQVHREPELQNLVQMIGFPALLVNKDQTILSVNAAFEVLTGVGPSSILNRSLQFIPDQALYKNMQALIQSAQAQPAATVSDQLDISGHNFKLSCQMVSGEYWVITISPVESAQGGAA
ncbi:MAG: FHA domain-containing protein [Proteobacteria bacterium]|jgi:PAS domain-containing protein|nr:FHA domain-containing protein [Pseudomonadota bacterium]